MYGLTRGTMTLIGVAVAGVLLWLASQVQADGNGEYWAQMGLIAAAGLTMALSQLVGGWTKWGWPRISTGVLALGFLPALVAGGLVLLDAQPGTATGSGWAAELGLNWLAEDLSGVLPAIAFALGLVFGLVFDTTGPLVDDDVEVVEEERHTDVVPADRYATDEPVVAGRHTDVMPADRYATDEPVVEDRYPERTTTTADVDGDGRREVVHVGDDVADEPVTAERHAVGDTTTADVDGDGRGEVVHAGDDDRPRRGLFRRRRR